MASKFSFDASGKGSCHEIMAARTEKGKLLAALANMVKQVKREKQGKLPARTYSSNDIIEPT